MNLSSVGAWQLVVLRLVLAVFMAALGAFLAVSFKKVNHRWLCLLISFAAGALLAVALLDIFPETFSIVGLFPGILSILSGYLLFWVLTKFVFHVCPACSATHTEVNFKAVSLAMIVALAVHSFMDGLAIYSGSVMGSQIGFSILLAVAAHKFPEGMALALVARASGTSRIKAFSTSFFIEALTTLAGGLVGFFFLVPESSQWMGVILGHVGGGFIFLVLHALLSEVVKHHPRSTLLAALSGAASIWIAQSYLS